MKIKQTLSNLKSRFLNMFKKKDKKNTDSADAKANADAARLAAAQADSEAAADYIDDLPLAATALIQADSQDELSGVDVNRCETAIKNQAEIVTDSTTACDACKRAQRKFSDALAEEATANETVEKTAEQPCPAKTSTAKTSGSEAKTSSAKSSSTKTSGKSSAKSSSGKATSKTSSAKTSGAKSSSAKKSTTKKPSERTRPTTDKYEMIDTTNDTADSGKS